VINFTKAHGCGNDFLIVLEKDVVGRDLAALTRALCERNTGVGADGVEYFSWVEKKDGTSKITRAGRIRLHNADGSIAEISGNGTRCVAAWMAAELDSKIGDLIEIETDAGLRVGQIEAIEKLDDAVHTVRVRTGMGVPILQPKTVVLHDGADLSKAKTSVSGMAISMGNPQFVILVESDDFGVAGRTWQSVGAEICTHGDFPQQVNVEFVRVKSRSEIEIRIFERGVGPTNSSGSGTSASAVAAIAQGLAESLLVVVSPGGSQKVEWKGAGEELFLTGPATLVACGEFFA
jgi:diaminopimelate epimerase